jgi:hypothetical protein
MMTEEQKKFFNKQFALKGRILFPHLLKPKVKDNGREVYEVQFAWRPEENATMMQQLMQFMQQATQLVHPGINPLALIQPIKDFNTYVKQNGAPNPEYLRGQLWVNASTGLERPPHVVKQSPMGLVKLGAGDEAELYSGRNAVVAIGFWPMLPKPGTPVQKRGFYVNLEAVLLQDGGERIGGGGSNVDINQVFGAFASDMGLAPQPGLPPVMGNAIPQGNVMLGTIPSGVNQGHFAGHTAQPTASPSSQPAWPPVNGLNPFQQ